MDETISNLVGGLLDTMAELGVELGGNTIKLARWEEYFYQC